MKKFVGFALMGAMLLGGSMVYAGGACCSGHGDSAKAMGCGSDTLSKLNLTPDQQKKVDALVAECSKGKCTPEARDNFTKAMKDILTADQFTQWQAAIAKASKGECPMHKSDTKS